MFQVNNKRRIRSGHAGSDNSVGNNGAFLFNRIKYKLRAIVSDGEGWEHVSITRSDSKMPTWKDMCYMKAQFWGDEDVVMQLHPAKSEWISNHDKCLHLWRPTFVDLPLPPSEMVGVLGISSQDVNKLSHEERCNLLDDINRDHSNNLINEVEK